MHFPRLLVEPKAKNMQQALLLSAVTANVSNKITDLVAVKVNLTLCQDVQQI
jgi:hypothetical protein